MVAQADHHRKITRLHQSLELLVRISNKRAGAIRDNQATPSESFAPPVRSAVGRNHDAGSLRSAIGRFFANALSAQMLAHDRVVHQLAENGEGRFPGERFRLSDGVTDAEADSKMCRNNDLHSLCVTKHSGKNFYFLPALCHSERKR